MNPLVQLFAGCSRSRAGSGHSFIGDLKAFCLHDNITLSYVVVRVSYPTHRKAISNINYKQFLTTFARRFLSCSALERLTWSL
jgi:hypothetical protein